ncbi:MAG TPA: DUF4185 domain-containing protein [Kofleriaceae bacterium]|nr:DUF4185 domain-containing protein [Kofleriaceae bacterium]
MMSKMQCWLVLVGGGVMSVAGCGDAPSTIDVDVLRVEDLGVLPQPSTVVVGRDGGPAGVLRGRMLWTFGDTFLGAQNPVDNSNVLSATGGWSSLTTPLDLLQPVDPNGFPAQLIPYTAEELAQNRAAPLDGWALWPSAVIDTGGAEALVTFQRIKRTNGSGYDSQGIGMARIAVDAPMATRIPGDLFAPPEPLFMPQSVIDGNVYAFACSNVGFLNVGCKFARAPVGDADKRAAYTFFDGAAWQSDIARAAVVLDGVGGMPTISWNPYLAQYLAVSGKILSSTVQLRTAAHIEGPWSDPVELPATADGSSGIFAPTSSDAFNYVIIEHPELRSLDGHEIVISYSRPTEPFRGDVRLAKLTLR